MKLTRILNELLRTDWADKKAVRILRNNAEDVITFFGEDEDIRNITYKRCVDFVSSLKAKGLGGSTINRKTAALSKMFTVAMRHDPKIRRPEIPREKEGKPRARVIKDKQAAALIDYPWTYWYHRALMVILIDTGIRPSEILEGEWHVEGDELTLIDTKNGDDRIVLLTPEAAEQVEMLGAYLKAGNRICYSNFHKHFKKAKAALGLPNDVVPYTMRHTALTKLAERTDNVLLIQKWAGHRSLQTTQRYVKATRKGLDKLALVLRRS